MIKRSVRRAIDKLFSKATRLLGAAALAVVIGLAAPAAAFAVQQDAVSPYTFTPRRTGASLAVVMALVGTIIGGRALTRAAGRIGANGRRGAMVALALGSIGLVGGVVVVVTAKGGLGTGNGLAGGVVAMILGLIGMTLAGMALARARRTAASTARA